MFPKNLSSHTTCINYFFKTIFPFHFETDDNVKRYAHEDEREKRKTLLS